MTKIKTKQMTEVKFDQANINKHSEEGMELLDKSIEDVGWTEAIVVSDDDTAISGNARTEKALEKGFNEAILVETDGSRPVIIKRTDIKKDSEKFVKAKILANTVAKHNYVEDATVAEAVCEEYNLDPGTYGLDEPGDEENTTIKKLGIEPYHKTHILLSFPPDKLIYIQGLIEQISKVEGVEIEQSSN